MYLEHRLSALPHLNLHSRLNTRFDGSFIVSNFDYCHLKGSPFILHNTNYVQRVFLNISRNSRESINKMHSMMTSSNGNFFRVIGRLCGGFTGHRWIPLTKASDAELWFFFFICVWINDWLNDRKASDLRRHRAHYDFIVMDPGKGSMLCMLNITHCVTKHGVEYPHNHTNKSGMPLCRGGVHRMVSQ